MENVITLGKLVGLLLLSSLPLLILLSVNVHTKKYKNESPCNGNNFSSSREWKWMLGGGSLGKNVWLLYTHYSESSEA